MKEPGFNSKKEHVKSFFSDSEKYLNQNAIIVIRQKILRQNLNSLQGKDIIDVGCGDASVTAFLAEKNDMTFLDFSDEMLARARLKFNSPVNKVNFIKGDIDHYNSDDPYDIVISLGLLAHVIQVSFTLKQMAALVKPNGLLILQFTETKNILSLIIRLKNKILNKNPGYEVNPTKFEDINVILSNIGFNLVKRIPYWAVMPGIGKFSFKLRVKILQFLYMTFPFSKIGNENIVIYSKNLSKS